MSQQKPYRSEDDTYKKKLFYDNGIKFVEVKGRMTNDYSPPTPVPMSHVNQSLQSSAGLIARGTSHYVTSITFFFTSKKEYADWLQYIGSTHKFYDEKGTIYVGIVEGELDVRPVEQGSKYIVSVGLVLIKKQEFEFRHKAPFIDIDEHWARVYIDEMQQRGIITVYNQSGEEVPYFKPETYVNRAETVSFFTRTFKHIDKLLRGY